MKLYVRYGFIFAEGGAALLHLGSFAARSKSRCYYECWFWEKKGNDTRGDVKAGLCASFRLETPATLVASSTAVETKIPLLSSLCYRLETE